MGAMLSLRPLRPDDFDALFAAASDPLVWEQHPEPDLLQVVAAALRKTNHLARAAGLAAESPLGPCLRQSPVRLIITSTQRPCTPDIASSRVLQFAACTQQQCDRKRS